MALPRWHSQKPKPKGEALIPNAISLRRQRGAIILAISIILAVAIILAIILRVTGKPFQAEEPSM